MRCAGTGNRPGRRPGALAQAIITRGKSRVIRLRVAGTGRTGLLNNHLSRGRLAGVSGLPGECGSEGAGSTGVEGNRISLCVGIDESGSKAGVFRGIAVIEVGARFGGRDCDHPSAVSNSVGSGLGSGSGQERCKTKQRKAQASDNGAQGRRSAGTKERRDEGAQGRRSAGTKQSVGALRYLQTEQAGKTPGVQRLAYSITERNGCQGLFLRYCAYSLRWARNQSWALNGASPGAGRRRRYVPSG